MPTNIMSSMRSCRDALSRILAGLHTYTTAEKLRFVDRDGEAEAILSNLVAPNKLSVIVGPRGCGKSELAQALVYTLHGSNRYAIIYVRYEGEETILKTIVSSNIDLRGVIKSIVGKTVETVGTQFNIPGVLDLFKLLSEFIERRLRLDKKDIIVIVDEVRGKPSEVRQILEVEADLVRELSRYYKSLKVIYLASDATVASLVGKVGFKVQWYLIWNLPYKSFVELCKQLNPPNNMPTELVYSITGGNPRETIELGRQCGWVLGEYMRRKMQDVYDAIDSYIKDRGVDDNTVLREARVFVENIDMAGRCRLWDYMEAHNIVMSVDARFTKLTPLPKEPWIGSRKAFQLPVYYWILKTMVEHGSVSIEPRMVLEMIAGSLQPS